MVSPVATTRSSDPKEDWDAIAQVPLMTEGHAKMEKKMRYWEDEERVTIGEREVHFIPVVILFAALVLWVFSRDPSAAKGGEAFTSWLSGAPSPGTPDSVPQQSLENGGQETAGVDVRAGEDVASADLPQVGESVEATEVQKDGGVESAEGDKTPETTEGTGMDGGQATTGGKVVPSPRRNLLSVEEDTLADARRSQEKKRVEDMVDERARARMQEAMDERRRRVRESHMDRDRHPRERLDRERERARHRRFDSDVRKEREALKEKLRREWREAELK